VTYISSRMSTMLGKPATQLLGHSLPALLGGHAELGRVLLEKQPFNSLDMELTTARGTRWVSMAPCGRSRGGRSRRSGFPSPTRFLNRGEARFSSRRSPGAEEEAAAPGRARPASV